MKVNRCFLGTLVLLLTPAAPVVWDVQKPAYARPTGDPKEPLEEVLIRLPSQARDAGRVRTAVLLPQIFNAVGGTGTAELCNPHSSDPVFRVRLATPLSIETLRGRLKEWKAVPFPNYEYELEELPQDPYFKDQWSLDNSGQSGLADVDINAPEAWHFVHEVRPSIPVAVAVIDTGVQYEHPDLAGSPNVLPKNIWVNEKDPIDGVDNDGNFYIDDFYGLNALTAGASNAWPMPAGDPKDEDSHGTAIAGIIAAIHNTRFVAGIAPHAKVIVCKAVGLAGTCTSCNAIRCMDYIADLKQTRCDVDIVATNNSFGIATADPNLDALDTAIEEHRQLGILYVASAGNASKDCDLFPHSPSGSYRANVIAVASTDASDKFDTVSNWGSRTAHVAAPAAQVPVLNLILPTPTPSGGPTPFPLPDQVDKKFGSSMAAAHVTGLIALLHSYDVTRIERPNWDWKALRNLILAGGAPVTVPGRATITDRRLRAWESCSSPPCSGSLTCADQVVQKRLRPIALRTDAGVDAVDIDAGKSLDIGVLNISCAAANGPIKAVIKETCNGIETNVDLLDDGNGFDDAEKDGIYSISWTPPANWGVLEVTLLDAGKTVDTFKACLRRTPLACSC